MGNSFKDHKFSEAELLWLTEVYKSKEFDPRVARVKLRDKLPKGFDPMKIDDRFLVNGKNLTVLGVWCLDPDSILIKHIKSVIIAIKDLIIKNPGIQTITAKQVSSETKIEESYVGIALQNLSTLGNFISSATGFSDAIGYSKIELSDYTQYDAYLGFENFEDLMEQYYKGHGRHYETGGYWVTAPGSASLLTSVASAGVYHPYPFLETTKYEIKRDTVFVLMAMDPDDPELEDVYQTIKQVCGTFGLKAYRANEIEHQDRITDLILSEIKSCEFLIADLTHERPNVYYEVGYAHALNKRPILYRKTGTRLHFDLFVHNAPEYKNMTELKGLLKKRLEAILGRSSSSD